MLGPGPGFWGAGGTCIILLSFVTSRGMVSNTFILQDSPFCNPEHDALTQASLTCHCPHPHVATRDVIPTVPMQTLPWKPKSWSHRKFSVAF